MREADDWLLGWSGPREAAEAIKDQLKAFLRKTRKLTLSEATTRITHARPASARCLGYAVVTQPADDQHCRAQHRRCINGALGRKSPVEVLRTQCARSMRRGQPTHVAARLHATDDRIVTPDQAAYRGVVPYCRMAFNGHRWGQLPRVRQCSLAQTLAKKHRTSVQTLWHTHRAPGATPHGPLRVLEVQHQRGEGQTPLLARGGGIALRWHRHGLLNEQPKEGYGRRSEGVQRRLAPTCERCGAQEQGAGHHLRRLADLHKPGRQENPLGGQRMGAYRRKTLGTCRACHEALHRKRPGQRHVPT